MVISPTNAPSDVGSWHAIEVNYSEGNYYLKAYVFDTQREYSCRRRYSEDWGEWTPTATSTPSQEFDLPLAEGVTPVTSFKNTYSKDQFGIVRVWFSVRFESIPEVNAPVFTLPEGFRPDSICCSAAILSMNEFYCATINVHPSGGAIIGHGTIGQSGAINLHGFIEFPAAS